MRKLLNALLVVTSVVLTACGANDVIQAGPSTYLVSGQEFLVAGGWPAAQREAIAKATQYCATKGQQFTLLGEMRGGTPGFTTLSSSITFACGADITAQNQSAQAQCASELQSPALDPIRQKIELSRTSPDAVPAFEVTSNDTFPTESERAVIAKWATIRDECNKRSDAIPSPPSANPVQAALFEQDRSFARELIGRVGELIVALYQAKLTYGEFAQKRYEFGRDEAAAERQFRTAALIADRDRQVQAQQLAQQQFQNTLIAWSAYMQAVNARQPQTVYLQGTVRVRTNCNSTQLGAFTSTQCN